MGDEKTVSGTIEDGLKAKQRGTVDTGRVTQTDSAILLPLGSTDRFVCDTNHPLD